MNLRKPGLWVFRLPKLPVKLNCTLSELSGEDRLSMCMSVRGDIQRASWIRRESSRSVCRWKSRMQHRGAWHERGRAAAEFPSAELILVEGAGHGFTEPDLSKAVSKAVEFIEEHIGKA